MSFTKHYMEEEESKNNLVNALKSLRDHEKFGHGTEIGVAEKIIADQSVNGLSKKQMAVFEEYIEPLLEPNCERSHCGKRIDISDLPNALLHENELGGLHCRECIDRYYYDQRRMEKE